MFIMKSFLVQWFVCLTFTVQLVSLEEAKVKLLHHIIGGKAARLNQFPFQASVRLNGCHVCGATIISRKFVLTAGHCIAKSFKGIVSVTPAKNFAIRAGSTDLLSREVVRQVSGITLHPLFNTYYNYTLLNGTEQSKILHDLAILKLKNALDFNSQVSSIRLATSDIPYKSSVTISGWGKISNNRDQVSQYLQHAKMQTISRKESYKYHGKEASEFILDLRASKRRGACMGDSGGPAVFNNSLVGTCSFGGSKCADADPDSYVRIWRYYDWIESNSDYSHSSNVEDTSEDEDASNNEDANEDEDAHKDEGASKDED